MHFRRRIQGTATMEYQQVRFSKSEPDIWDLKIDRWTKSGGSTTHKVTHLDGRGLVLLKEAEIEAQELNQAGWELCHLSDLDGTEDQQDLVLIKIDAVVDLTPDVEALAEALLEVDLRIEKDGSFMAGPIEIEMARSRRKAGETRDLRYDRISAKVPKDSIAARVLTILSLKHGGKLLDMTSTPIDQDIFLGSFDEDLRFDPIIEHFELDMPKRIRPVHWTSPWGRRIQPAVF